MGPYRHKYVRTFVKRSVITGQRHIISHLNGSHLEIIIFVYKLYAFYIHYDYTGIENWATAQWKTNNDLTRSYKETMQAWAKRVRIRFVKVAAHKGIEGNERADGLAKKGLTCEPGVLPI